MKTGYSGGLVARQVGGVDAGVNGTRDGVAVGRDVTSCSWTSEREEVGL